MIDLVDRNQCTGCESCLNACPLNCIMMKTDAEGFSQPYIEREKCVQCGICKSSCPVLNEAKDEIEPGVFYVAYDKNTKNRRKSSSGGVFALFADYVIRNGGVVVGAAYDGKLNVYHKIVDDAKGIDKLRGSKYVQSSIGSVYRDVKKYLNAQKIVLFSGTSCQVSGLKRFLGRTYENLYCVAIICHGTPTRDLWASYVRYYKVKEVDFRDKRRGWHTPCLFTRTKSKWKLIYHDYDPYCYAFNHNLSLRRSCYDCNYRLDKCEADLLLGDAWGIEDYALNLDDNNGASIIIKLSQKGDILLHGIDNRIELCEVNKKTFVNHNPRIMTSVKLPRWRKLVLKFRNSGIVWILLMVFVVKEYGIRRIWADMEKGRI